MRAAGAARSHRSVLAALAGGVALAALTTAASRATTTDPSPSQPAASAAATVPSPSAATTAPSPSAATEDRPAVGAGALRIQITTISPAVPRAGGVLKLAGRITNVAGSPVEAVSVRMRISSGPLGSRGEIPDVLAGGAARRGVGLAVSARVADRMEPAATATFELSSPVNDLDLDRAGVYAIGVEAVADAGSGTFRQDLDRTFLPWWPPGTKAQPVLLTTLWPLTAPPSQDANGTLLSESVGVDLSPHGRLATLLSAASGKPGAVTMVVDPALAQLAADMADGYQVRTAAGTEPGTRADEASDWLDQLRAAVAEPRADSAGLLYGWPDLTAARSGRLLTTMMRQRALVDRLTRSVLGRPLPSDVAMLAGGAADERTLRRLADLDVGTTVLSAEALPTTAPVRFTPSQSVVLPTAAGDLRVLAADTGLSQALAMPMADEAGRTAARQRLLAETLLTALELPGTQRLLVAAPDPSWAPTEQAARMVVDVFSGTPWVTPSSLEDTTSRDPSSMARTLTPYGATAAELPASQATAVAGQYRGIALYSQALTDPTDLPPTLALAPNRGMSAWFRAQSGLGRSLARSVTRQVNRTLVSVRVVSSGSITVSGTTGTIPVTVENRGEAPVTVGLTLTSTPAQLVRAEPVTPFRIDPGRRRSLEVRATVTAGGPVPVTIQPTTEQGMAFGSPGQLTVRSSAYANAAGVLVRLALVALFLAVLIHGIRRARRRRGPPEPSGRSPQRESEVVGG